MTDNLPLSMYGVWIANKGWWRLNGRAYSTFKRDEAQHYANFAGGVVRPIDKQLEEGESEMVNIESGKLYNRLLKRLRKEK